MPSTSHDARQVFEASYRRVHAGYLDGGANAPSTVRDERVPLEWGTDPGTCRFLVQPKTPVEPNWTTDLQAESRAAPVEEQSAQMKGESTDDPPPALPNSDASIEKMLATFDVSMTPRAQAATDPVAAQRHNPKPVTVMVESSAGVHLPTPPADVYEVAPVARWGWRGVLNRVVHLNLKADEVESAWHNDRQAIRRASWPHTAQIAIVSTEGGVGRTAMTLALAMALGDARRGQVAAWDGSRAGGPLALLAEPGGEGFAPLRDGITDAETVAAMSSLVARQSCSADVLGWRIGGADRPLTVEDFERARSTLSRHYALTVVDTGPDTWDATWEHAVMSSDALILLHSDTTRGQREAERTARALQRMGGEYLGRTLPVRLIADMKRRPQATAWAPLPCDPAFRQASFIHWENLSREFRCAATRIARQTLEILDKEIPS